MGLCQVILHAAEDPGRIRLRSLLLRMWLKILLILVSGSCRVMRGWGRRISLRSLVLVCRVRGTVLQYALPYQRNDCWYWD